MMKRFALVVGLALFDLPVAVANGVFKCTDAAGVVVYQGSPCGGQHVQVTLVDPRKREPEAANGAAMNVPAAGSPAQPGNGENRSFIAGDELVVGMSDTKVLNMRGWGRPQNIARSRGEDGWREEWTYVSRADGATRLVQFVNGKVAGTRSQDAQPPQLARARVELHQRADTPHVALASPRPQTPPIEIAQESPRPQQPQVIEIGQTSPRHETQTVDQTTRANEAARVVENLARRGAPRTGASTRWESATVDPAQSPMPAPPEQGAASRQRESVPVEEPPLRVTPPAPNREPLHIVNTQPPENAPLSHRPQPTVVMHSSAALTTGEHLVVQ